MTEENHNFNLKSLPWHRNSLSSNDTNKVDSQTIILIKSFHILRKIEEKMIEEKLNKGRNQWILNEWKELACKLEFIFCIL
jgi:hypothetical protein